MTILPGTRVAGVAKAGQGVTLTLAGKSSGTVDCDRVLVAAGAGRAARIWGWRKPGSRWTRRGGSPSTAITRPVAPAFSPIGDLIHGPMLAHKAMDEGVVCVERWHGELPEVDYTLIPGVVYTQPEVASVGQSEEQLKVDGVAYTAGRFPFLASGRAKALDESEGSSRSSPRRRAAGSSASTSSVRAPRS